MLKETYITTELCVLLSVTRKAVLERADREKWEPQERQGRGGGFCFPLSGMPQVTQLAIRTAEERKALAALEGIVAPHAIDGMAFSKAVINSMADSITNKRRSKALLKADLLRLYLAWQRKHGMTIAQKKAFIVAYQGGAWPDILDVLGLNVSWKSLERWKLKQSRSGSVLALADTRGIAHKGRSYLTEQHRVIILGHVLNPNAPGVSSCVRKIQERCKAENLYVPSDATIRRFVAAYTEECFDEWTLWREGKKAWNDKCAISILRDWSLIEVGDVVIADGHTLNFETIDPDTGKPKRMTLLLFYDGASGHPLGWEIMASENVACISSAFRRTCLILGKFPLVVYIDNGKAFRAKFFKGVSDFRQAGFIGLYEDLGCEVIHAWPYHGQSKPIERFFGSFHDMEVFVPSYTGNNIDRKPARMKRGEDLHRKLYEKLGGRPLTMEETHTAIAMWFCEYAQRPNDIKHLQGRTPAEVFQAGVGPGVDERRLTLMMLQKEIKTISKDGIRHLGRLYWHEALAPRRHSVLVRYDDQLSPHTVYVYTMDGEFICAARDREHYKIAAGLHPAARILGTAEQQQDLSDAIELKRGQERLAGANLRHMLDVVVLPETQKRQAAIMQAEPAKRLALPAAPRGKKLTAAEIATIDAATEKARADFDTNLHQKSTYKPAALMRFKDELAKYEYLFTQKHQHGEELVADDAAWMTFFEETPTFQRNYKRRYDMLLEVFIMQRQAV